MIVSLYKIVIFLFTVVFVVGWKLSVPIARIHREPVRASRSAAQKSRIFIHLDKEPTNVDIERLSPVNNDMDKLLSILQNVGDALQVNLGAAFGTTSQELDFLLSHNIPLLTSKLLGSIDHLLPFCSSCPLIVD